MPTAYLSRASLAHELDISESTVDEMVRRGVLPKHAMRRKGEPMWCWEEIDRRLQRLPQVGMIYVIGFDHYVKIGFSFGPIQYRLSAIQVGCPRKLQVYAEIEGTFPEEKALHRRFAAYSTHGEWFVKTGNLAAWIEGGCK